jgi:DNA polymerase III alpha subunit
MPKLENFPLPTVGVPDGPGWRMRSGREARGMDDRDPRGREAVDAPLRPDSGELLPFHGRKPDVPYVELHCHTCYSFREGASTPRELAARAAALGYEALAVTDRDGLYGAMEFAKAAEEVGIRPIIGADVTLQGGYQLVLLAETREGYSNLCELLSQARLAEAQDGVRPEIPAPHVLLSDLTQHTGGLIALSGDAHGEVPTLLAAGHVARAAAAARRYLDWFGPEHFFLELQQTLTYGDTRRNQLLIELGRNLGILVVATNDVWYHVRERHRLHDVLVATKHRLTLDGSHRVRHANSERYLKTPGEMAALFEALPEALHNAADIAERCRFDLVRDLGYVFPHADVPPEETADSYLASVCWEALGRKYGEGSRLSARILSKVGAEPCDVRLARNVEDSRREDGVVVPLFPRGRQEVRRNLVPAVALLEPPVRVDVPEWSTPSDESAPSDTYQEAVERLEEELALIAKHGLAGFFLAYYGLLKMAGQVARELRGRDPDLPPDERPVGRGRGSSVSSIVCYLIGLSHIDPIANELFLGRFLNDELPSIPDIDLDFPRDIREEILKRIWTEFDEGRAALVCAYSTYHTRSAIRDVGKALGLPALEIDHLAKLSDAWSSIGMDQ